MGPLLTLTEGSSTRTADGWKPMQNCTLAGTKLQQNCKIAAQIPDAKTNEI
jgi:hypothetical protein